MKLDWFYAVKLVLITVLTLALHVMLEPGGGVTPQRYLSGPCTSAACARDFLQRRLKESLSPDPGDGGRQRICSYLKTSV